MDFCWALLKAWVNFALFASFRRDISAFVRSSSNTRESTLSPTSRRIELNRS